MKYLGFETRPVFCGCLHVGEKPVRVKDYDNVWMMRDMVQDARNEERRRSWAARFRLTE